MSKPIVLKTKCKFKNPKTKIRMQCADSTYKQYECFALTLGTIFISVTFRPSVGPTFRNLKFFTSSACQSNKTKLQHPYVCKKKKQSKSSAIRKAVCVKKQTYRNVLMEKWVFTVFSWSATAAVLVLSLVLHGTDAAGTGLGGPSLIHGGRNVVLWVLPDI